MDIGIDLGTTFCVMGVKGKIELAEGYPPGEYIPEFDVTLIPSPTGETEIPSVVWASPDDPDEVLVGLDAKMKADEGESPIMFAKRAIGTEERLRIHGRELSAVDVSTRILQFLKQCAEQALGDTITRAVITHPAYFDPGAIAQTREAAVAAGFDMSLPQQLLMEPAAAAIAYLKSDKRDPLKVLTYDLGGGTFDVTVLERREGVIDLLAFDGDHLLGGYNFDRALVQWLRERQKEKGRTPYYDAEDDAHRGRRAQLLVLAENIKERLSQQKSDNVTVPISGKQLLVDENDRPIPISERISRKEYSKLLEPHLKRTLECCRSALEKAKLTIQDIDEVLMVGGSTHGPWVQQAVRQGLEREIMILEPDKCVGAGAAVLASELPPRSVGGGMELVLDVPKTSPLDMINIAGSLRRKGGSGPPEQHDSLRVLLKQISSAVSMEAQVDKRGRFLFEDVELASGETAFALSIINEGGTVIHEAFSVEYDPEAEGEAELTIVLPKPLFLKTRDGMKSIVEEGRKLPAECELEVYRQHGDDKVQLEIYQGLDPVGSVWIENIPRDAGQGSKIIINVEITRHNEVRGTARVLAPGSDKIAAQCDVQISFPPIPVPNLNELKDKLSVLREQSDQIVASTADRELKARLKGKGERILRNVDALMDEMEPDRQEISRLLNDYSHMIDPKKDDLKPSRAEFRATVEEVRELIEQKSGPEKTTLETQIDQLEEQGREAAQTKNRRTWAHVYDGLLALRSKLQPRSSGGASAKELPPTPILKEAFGQMLEQARKILDSEKEKLRTRKDYQSRILPRADGLAAELDRIEAAIRKVSDDLPPNQGFAQLQLLNREKEEVERKAKNLEIDVIAK